MNDISIDPFVFRKTTILEIHKIIEDFCKDADKLVMNYPNYFCRNHDDIGGFGISKVDEHIFQTQQASK